MPENTVATTAAPPDPNDILSGSVSQTGSTGPTTVITVPAGRTWRGNVTVEATFHETTFAVHWAEVRVAGAGAVPAAGDVIVRAHSHREIVTTVATVPEVYVVAPEDNDVTLDLHQDIGLNMHTHAACHGVLI